jgi:hypothetical protein
VRSGAAQILAPPISKALLGFITGVAHPAIFDEVQPTASNHSDRNPARISVFSGCLQGLSAQRVWYPNCPAIDVAWAEKGHSPRASKTLRVEVARHRKMNSPIVPQKVESELAKAGGGLETADEPRVSWGAVSQSQ